MTRIDPDDLQRAISRVRILTEGVADQSTAEVVGGDVAALPDGFLDTLESSDSKVVMFTKDGGYTV